MSCLHFTNTINALNIIWPSLLHHSAVTSMNHRGHCFPLKGSSVSNLRSLYCFSHTIAICQLCETIHHDISFFPSILSFPDKCDTLRLLETEMLKNEESAVTSVKLVLSGSRGREVIWLTDIFLQHFLRIYLDLITHHLQFGVCKIFYKKFLKDVSHANCIFL